MSDDIEIRRLLERMEENQRTALEIQQKQLALAKSQLEFSSKSIEESVQLQRTAVARQSKLALILLPVVGVLLLLIVYLLFRWNVL